MTEPSGYLLLVKKEKKSFPQVEETTSIKLFDTKGKHTNVYEYAKQEYDELQALYFDLLNTGFRVVKDQYAINVIKSTEHMRF